MRLRIGWLGVALIAGAYLMVSEEFAFPGFIALVPAAGSVMVLLGGVQESRVGPNAILALGPAQWVGKLSYSLYLWHWPVVVYAAMLVPELTGLHIALLVALTFALSLFSYHFIENPIRRNGWLIAGTARSLGFAALITTTGAAIAYASATLAARNLNADPQQRMIAESAERPSIVRQTDPRLRGRFRRPSSPSPACSARRHPTRLSCCSAICMPTIGRRRWSRSPSKDNFRLVTFMKSSCRATRITTRVWSLKRTYTECDDWRELALKQIIAMKPNMVIISQFAISNMYLEVDRPVRICRAPQGMGRGREIDGRGARAMPASRSSSCATSRSTSAMSTNAWRARSGRAGTVGLRCTAGGCDGDADSAIERDIISKIRNARYVDLTNLFCDATRCHAMIDGKLAFRDRHHIAAPYAASLAPPLERASS